MERSRKGSDWPSRPAVVVFDLGEVLASPAGLMARLAGLADAKEGAFEAAYWQFRDEHDGGGSAQEYWNQVLRTAGATPSDDLTQALSQADAEAWTSIRPDAEAALAGAAAGGFVTAILSNAPRELAAVARRTAWAAHVARWFFSGELRMSKPDPRLFAHVTAELGVAPAEILFLDDRAVNVEAALAAGWNAWQWTSAAGMREILLDHDVPGSS